FLPKFGTIEENEAWKEFFGAAFSYSQGLDLFVLARWCAQHGERDLALTILDRLQLRKEYLAVRQYPNPLEVKLQAAAARFLWRPAVFSIGDRAETRSDLLKKLRQIEILCPKANLDYVHATTETLERMIREDAEHPTLSDAQLAALPPAERARELIFRLRNDRWIPIENQDFWARGDAAWPGNGAYKALLQLGFDAVPALVDALDDHSITRQPPYMVSEKEVWRVRDFALSALCEISCLSFGRSPKDSEETDHEFRIAGARAWGKAASEKGEKRCFIEGLELESPSCIQCARRLLEKYPEDGIPAIIDAARHRTRASDRGALEAVLRSANDPRCTAYFEELLHEAASRDRIAGAFGLWKSRDPRAVRAMRNEWTAFVTAHEDSPWPTPGSRDDFENPFSIICFLADSQDPDAVLDLDRELPKIPPKWRAKAFEPFFANPAGPAGAVAKTWNKTFEDLFVESLRDTAEVRGIYFWSRVAHPPVPIIRARVCDVAANALHEWLPKKYAFDPWLSPEERTRQCIVCANVRARESGDPQLPLSPALETQKSELDARVDAADCEAPPDGSISEFARRLQSLKGSPFSSEALISALIEYASHPVSGTKGFRLTISRFRDRSGLELHAEFSPGESPEPSSLAQATISSMSSFSRSHNSGPLADWADPKMW
ncbi:MAG TPA: hypothetical protein VGH90_11540, partial [Chthoniobacteraceae bacterium]